MTTTTLPRSVLRPEAVPPLENGDRLSREEFERRYEAMPHLKKAELLRGVVYMPSPVRIKQHGGPHADLVGCIVLYKMLTPGLLSGDNSTIRLGPDDEPQPDILLMIPADRGGQAVVGPEGYVEGAPELAAEVAASSASYDVHLKRSIYEEQGIREYIIWRVEDQAVDWFMRRDGVYQPLEPGPDGIFRSEVFPGLWLDPAALIRGDGARLIAVLQEGIASPEHVEFAKRLQG